MQYKIAIYYTCLDSKRSISAYWKHHYWNKTQWEDHLLLCFYY